ncbi:membrane-associated phospholipid phosphatase [Peptoniphilus olsenii]|uniref:Membrane-associated phospholipid phosphatase n=1 Tax=Peptoniphilus olsenii TaxID=411570 RepID=A0ABV2JAT4_9FIRM
MNTSDVVKYQIIMILIQIVLYFGCEIFQKNPKYINIPLDEKIPLITLFTLIYIMWFPIIAIFPISLFKSSVDLYKIYMATWIIDVLISILIYIIYPTTFIRPKDLDKYFGGWMLKIIYKFSYKGLNCMPSLHCSLSTIIFIFANLSKTLPVELKIIYSLLSIGIIISTLFTKQHVIIDMMTGVGLGILSCVLGFVVF